MNSSMRAAIPLLGVALLVLLAGARAAPDHPSVTVPLREYEQLFKERVQHDMQEGMEAKRVRSENLMKERERVLEAKMEAATAAATQRKQREEMLPGNWQLVHHVARGEASLVSGENLAKYNFTLSFRVFENEWTSIPLIDAQTIVADIAVSRANESAGPREWAPVELGEEALTVLKDRTVVVDDVAWQDHVLVVSRAGLYRVHIQAYVQVQNNRNLRSLALNLLHPLTSTRLRLLQEKPSHLRELSAEPAAVLTQAMGQGYTDIKAILQSSTTFSLKWRMQGGAGAAKDASVQGEQGLEAEVDKADSPGGQAAVIHDSIHSLEDGILQSTHVFKYSLDAEQSLSNVQINFLGPARVTSVVAHGMQSWQAVPLNATAEGETGTGVHVAFKASVISREVIVMVTTELEFDTGSRHLRLPVAVCQGVLRQPGTLAVVKVANVEIYEQKLVGASRAGVEDVPQHLRSRVGWPIVMAYKFLAPRHNITLSVEQHDEMSTLEALADAASYKAVVLESQLMQDYLVVLQNTRQQYMEVTGIPAQATLWSLKVNSVATKPVRTGEGRLLVPLLVGTSGRASTSKTSVQLTWLTSQAPMGNNGSLALHPPGVDMPIASLGVEVYLPENYAVEFAGSLRQVARFSQSQPSPVNYQTEKEVVTDNFDFASAPPPRASNKDAGVKAKIPKSGKRYIFEQLLVLPPGAQLTATYKDIQSEASEDSWANWASSLVQR